jgi:hypothetical protein
MSIKKAMAVLAMSAALMPQEDLLIPGKTGTPSKGYTRGKQMPRKWCKRRKKRMQMQKQSRKINRKP